MYVLPYSATPRRLLLFPPFFRLRFNTASPPFLTLIIFSPLASFPLSFYPFLLMLSLFSAFFQPSVSASPSHELLIFSCLYNQFSPPFLLMLSLFLASCLLSLTPLLLMLSSVYICTSLYSASHPLLLLLLRSFSPHLLKLAPFSGFLLPFYSAPFPLLLILRHIQLSFYSASLSLSPSIISFLIFNFLLTQLLPLSYS